MKDIIKYIKTENRVYPVVFNLNVMEEIQEQYGSMGEWANIVSGESEPKIKDLKMGLMAMINEAIDIENEKFNKSDAFISTKQVGRIMSEVGIEVIAETIKSITTESTSTGESKNE